MTETWIYNGVEFKAGDRVMVMRFVTDDEPDVMGEGREWNNVWVEDMNEAIFHQFEIMDISEEGVLFYEIEDFPASEYMYPLSVLKKL